METKLTLRLDDRLIRLAKREAAKRGKSVSRLLADYLSALASPPAATRATPSITESLTGVLRGTTVDERDYRTHLKEKYLAGRRRHQRRT